MTGMLRVWLATRMSSHPQRPAPSVTQCPLGRLRSVQPDAEALMLRAQPRGLRRRGRWGGGAEACLSLLPPPSSHQWGRFTCGRETWRTLGNVSHFVTLGVQMPIVNSRCQEKTPQNRGSNDRHLVFSQPWRLDGQAAGGGGAAAREAPGRVDLTWPLGGSASESLLTRTPVREG